jgi:hypothetical protein
LIFFLSRPATLWKVEITASHRVNVREGPAGEMPFLHFVDFADQLEKGNGRSGKGCWMFGQGSIERRTHIKRGPVKGYKAKGSGVMSVCVGLARYITCSGQCVNNSKKGFMNYTRGPAVNMAGGLAETTPKQTSFPPASAIV